MVFYFIYSRCRLLMVEGLGDTQGSLLHVSSVSPSPQVSFALKCPKYTFNKRQTWPAAVGWQACSFYLCCSSHDRLLLTCAIRSHFDSADPTFLVHRSLSQSRTRTSPGTEWQSLLKAWFGRFQSWHHGHVAVSDGSCCGCDCTIPLHTVHIRIWKHVSVLIFADRLCAWKADVTLLQWRSAFESRQMYKALEAHEKIHVWFTWREHTPKRSTIVRLLFPFGFGGSFSPAKSHGLNVHIHKHTQTCTHTLLAHVPPTPFICREFKHQSRVV